MSTPLSAYTGTGSTSDPRRASAGRALLRLATLFDASLLALAYIERANELPVAPATLRDPVVKVTRPLKCHGLEPTRRNHRLWKQRRNRDTDPRQCPPLRKGKIRRCWGKKPTDFRWESPINTGHMLTLVAKCCSGARLTYMQSIYKHGLPGHYRGPVNISSTRPNHISPGDEGSACVDTYIREAVAARAALITRVPIFPGTITLPAQVVKKERPDKPTKRRMRLDGSAGTKTRAGIADWAASEGARFTSDTTLMRLAEIVAYGAANGSLEDYHQAFRSMRVCTWGIPRSCIYWRGRFIYFGARGLGETVTPSHWESHADLLQREQTYRIRLLEQTALHQGSRIAAQVGLGPPGRILQSTINRIVDDTLITTPAHYSEQDTDRARKELHLVCSLAGQQRQLKKVARCQRFVAFDGFLLDLTGGKQRAGAPADKCVMITLLIREGLRGKIGPDDALSLIGEMERIAGVISSTSPLIPAFRACALAASGRSPPRARLSPDATADLRRWAHLLGDQSNGGAMWAPPRSLFFGRRAKSENPDGC